MKIVSLLENTSRHGLLVEHGLSLYIETEQKEKILFDMGQSQLFAQNARLLGIPLENIQLAILSHGHYDHGGGLNTFLKLNAKAPVYVHDRAFEPHYSLRDTGLHYIGLDPALKGHPQLCSCLDVSQINDHILLFSQVSGQCLCPPGNRTLFGPAPAEQDTFAHEQNLLITEGDKRILFAGCAHTGIVNILKKAEQMTDGAITHVIAGMHLSKHGLSMADETIFIQQLADHLLSHQSCQYYTMHCTGKEGYLLLKERMGSRIHYLSCGDVISVI